MIKVLIIRLSSIGDIIHTFPMIKDIKDNISNVSIDWLVDKSFCELLKQNKNVDNVIGIPLRKWKKNKLCIVSNFLKWRKNIKNKDYDFIIDAQGLIKSSILTRVFNGNSYGYNFKSAREQLASIFYKNRINMEKNVLATTKNRLLCQKIFNYKIDLSNVDFGIEDFFKDNNSNVIKNKYVIFFHAASKDEKKYPVGYWVNIAIHILEEYDLNIVLPYGNNKEKEEAIRLKDKINSDKVIVAEKIYNFTELSELIYGASFVIGVDTGLIHLANALNKKTIALYTNTNPSKTGIIESTIAKNLGGIKIIPNYKEVELIFDNIMKS